MIPRQVQEGLYQNIAGVVGNYVRPCYKDAADAFTTDVSQTLGTRLDEGKGRKYSLDQVDRMIDIFYHAGLIVADPKDNRGISYLGNRAQLAEHVVGVSRETLSRNDKQIYHDSLNLGFAQGVTLDLATQGKADELRIAPEARSQYVLQKITSPSDIIGGISRLYQGNLNAPRIPGTLARQTIDDIVQSSLSHADQSFSRDIAQIKDRLVQDVALAVQQALPLGDAEASSYLYIFAQHAYDALQSGTYNKEDIKAAVMKDIAYDAFAHNGYNLSKAAEELQTTRGKLSTRLWSHFDDSAKEDSTKPGEPFIGLDTPALIDPAFPKVYPEEIKLQLPRIEEVLHRQQSRPIPKDLVLAE